MALYCTLGAQWDGQASLRHAEAVNCRLLMPTVQSQLTLAAHLSRWSPGRSPPPHLQTILSMTRIQPLGCRCGAVHLRHSRRRVRRSRTCRRQRSIGAPKHRSSALHRVSDAFNRQGHPQIPARTASAHSSAHMSFSPFRDEHTSVCRLNSGVSHHTFATRNPVL
jgi:hypothetical protein